MSSRSKSLFSLFVLGCLNGCGGSSNSTDAALPPAVGLTLTADSFTVETARSNLLDVLANDGQNLQLLSVTGGQAISASIENNQLRYVARCCDQNADTLQYTASNAAGRTASASVQLTILPTLQQELRAPSLGTAAFRIEGGASPIGGVQASAVVRAPYNANNAVQIAYASNARGFELVSVLGAMSEQNQRSGNTGIVNAANWDAMRLSPLSTALAGSLIRLNEGQLPATSAQLQTALQRVDWQQVLERADLIHAVTSSSEAHLAAGKKLIDIALDDALSVSLQPSFNAQALLNARAQWLGSAPSLPTDKLKLYRGGNLLTPLALEFSGSAASGYTVLSAASRFSSTVNGNSLMIPVSRFNALQFDRIKRAPCPTLTAQIATFAWVPRLSIAKIDVTPITISQTPAGLVTVFEASLEGPGVVGFTENVCNPVVESAVRKLALRNVSGQQIVGPGTTLNGTWMLPFKVGNPTIYALANFNGSNVGLVINEGNQSGPRVVKVEQMEGSYQLRFDDSVPLSIQLLAKDGEAFSGVAESPKIATAGGTFESFTEIWFAKKQILSFEDSRFAAQRLSDCCTVVGVADINFDATGRPNFAQEVLPTESISLTDSGQLVVSTRLDGSFRNVEILTAIALLRDQRMLVIAQSAKNNFLDSQTAAVAKLVPLQ